jgi:hypothetical protein
MSQEWLGKIWDVPGLTIHQKGMIWHLTYNPKLTNRQLAKKLSCRHDSIPAIAESLTEKGYLTNVKAHSKARNNYVVNYVSLEESWQNRSGRKSHSVEKLKTPVAPLPNPSGSFAQSQVAPLPNHLIDNILNSTTGNDTKELMSLSDQKADPEYIEKCIKIYKIPIKTLTNAISITNNLSTDENSYNKYLNIAVCKLNSEHMTVEEATSAIAKKMRSRGSRVATAPQASYTVDQIVDFGRNYNVSFGAPYRLPKMYLYAVEGLDSAGVRYEIS